MKEESPDKQVFPTRRSSAQEFLYRRSDAPAGKESALCSGSVDLAAGQPAELLLAFPDLLSQRSFVEQALASLASQSRFAVMAVQVDPPAETPALEEERKMQSRIAQALDAVCKPLKGLWGQLESGLFGCFLPDMDEKGCQQAAAALQEEISKNQSETVSIGMAVFPCIDFTREQILGNARKALVHAAFFGPASRVCFDAVTLNISADQHYQERDIDAAVKDFQRALKLDAANVNVHNSLGICYAVMQDYERAAAEFDAALAADPQHVMATYNRGLIHALSEEFEAALEFFTKAWQRDPQTFEIAFQAARAYFELGDITKSREFFEQALQLSPNHGPSLRYLGKCLEREGAHDAAIETYIKAVKCSPNDAEALSRLGHLYAQKNKDLEIATIFCRQSVDIMPDSGAYRYRLAQVYLKSGQLPLAFEALAEALRLGYECQADLEKVRSMLDEQKAFS